MRTPRRRPAGAFVIGDVRDPQSVDRAMRGVDLVFHAAALKQVPRCEFFPLQAVQTNILGAANVMEAAIAQRASGRSSASAPTRPPTRQRDGHEQGPNGEDGPGVARNNPDSATRSSLRCATATSWARAAPSSPSSSSRSGAGEPLTVTDPDMTRFLMSLEDAVVLVEFAFGTRVPATSSSGRRPRAPIGDLAEAMASSTASSRDIRIIGTRHGEKLYETLATREEMAARRGHGRLLPRSADARELNYSAYFNEGDAAGSRPRTTTPTTPSASRSTRWSHCCRGSPTSGSSSVHELLGLSTAFVTTLLVGWPVLVLLRRRGVLDVPNARSSHARVTPRGGGIAVCVGAGLGLVVYAAPAAAWGVFAGAMVAAVVGFVDDLRGLSAVLRLAVQGLVSLALAVWLVGTADLGPLAWGRQHSPQRCG